MAAAFSTPVNTITRESLRVLIANNLMNTSVEFSPDCESMETESPIRKPNMQPISKKLFHSPLSGGEGQVSPYRRSSGKARIIAKKRKLILLPGSAEKMKKAYVTEYKEEGCEGMRRRVLISLFHNKEYSVEMDCGS